MSKYSRRNFLFTAGAAALGSTALKACSSQSTTQGTTGSSTTGGNKPVASPVAAAGNLETQSIRLGYLPIFEAAPLIIAQEKGLFAKYGMTDAQVQKQSAWGAARDNVELGSARGGIDGGQWQMPMPYLISDGKITKGNTKIPMYVLLQTSTQGNGIAIANKHLGKGLNLDASKAREYLAQLKSSGKIFTAAYTFPQSNQELWIRYWLGAAGIDPDNDVKLLVVPPAQTVANMKVGTMDGFSTGDPWPYRILNDKIGFMAALTVQMWEGHPEEYLAIRADWVDKHPNATKAVLKAIMEAQQWCDDPANRKEMLSILAQQRNFNVSQQILTPPLEGKYEMGDGQPAINDAAKGPKYWKDAKGSVSYPYKSHDLWFLTENVRWGMMPGDTDFKALINKVNREDLWREAAKEMSIADADIPKQPSRGVETFFDGTKFDPENPTAYLKSLKVKKVNV